MTRSKGLPIERVDGGEVRVADDDVVLLLEQLAGGLGEVPVVVDHQDPLAWGHRAPASQAACQADSSGAAAARPEN
jgi:hypothetical protein